MFRLDRTALLGLVADRLGALSLLRDLGHIRRWFAARIFSVLTLIDQLLASRI
jgi:hypothetical protein